MQNEDYRDILALSYSSIKDFKKMLPVVWKKVWIDKTVEKKDSTPLRKGSLTEDLIFFPETVEDKYLTNDKYKPSDSISYIVERVFEHAVDKGSLDNHEELIINYAKEVPPKVKDEKPGYGQSWLVPTLVTKVVKEGSEYFEFLKTTEGKCVLTAAEYMKALVMAEAIKISELVKPYLDPELNKFQFQIITDEDFPEKMKGCLDILHINDKRQEIRVVDFKTIELAYYFEYNARKFGYLDQMSIYSVLLMKWMAKNPQYENYAILPPMNIAIDSTYAKPYIYEYSPRELDSAWNGYSVGNKYQQGIAGVIKDIQWHIREDKWDYPIEHYLSGKMQLRLINYND